MMENRSHVKIDSLPIEIKNEVDHKLLDGITNKEISQYLQSKGYDVHLASVGHYRRGYLKKFENIRIAREYARLLSEDDVDRPATHLHEANNALISQIIMEALIDDEMSVGDKIKAAKTVTALQSAQVRNEKLKIEARKASGELHAAMNVLKAKVFETIGNNHPEVAQIIINIADEIETELINEKNSIKTR